EGAAAFARYRAEIGEIDESEVEAEKAILLQPFENWELGKRENPFTFMADLQEVVGEFNGIARTGAGLEEGLKRMLVLKERVKDLAVPESRMFNPGWHMARDQRFMVEICEAMIRCGILRAESRGSHWRLDHLDLDPEWGKYNLVARLEDAEVKIERRRTPEMPAELAALIDDKPAVSQAALQ